MKKTRRIWSALLALVMTLSLLPGASLNAEAADAGDSTGGEGGGSWADAEWVEVDDALRLHELLEDRDHDYNIRLTGDISFSIGLSSSVGDDSDPEQWPYSPKGPLYWCRPRAVKVLDLYGHDIRISHGNSGRNGQGYNHYLFKLESYKKAENGPFLYPSMTVTDSTVSPGTVNFNGYVCSPDSLLGCYHNYRNLFYVGCDCSLTINGGEFICGRSKEQWISRGIRVDDFIDAVKGGNTFLDSLNVVYDDRFDGYARQNVNGHVIYNAGGSVTVNGGVLSGRGYEKLNFTVRTDNSGRPYVESTKERNAAIINSWGTLKIVDGDIRGMGCADALQIDNLVNEEHPTRVSDVSILGGEFSVDDVDKVVAPMNDDAVGFEWHLDGYYIKGTNGVLVKDLQSGKEAEAIDKLIDEETSVLTMEDDDEATVTPQVQSIPLDQFYTSSGPAAGSHYIYDPETSFSIQFSGSSSYEDVCPPFWYPVPDFPGRIWLEDVTARWFLYDGDGNRVGSAQGYEPGSPRCQLSLSDVLTNEEKANLSGTLVAVFCQTVTRHGATTMEARREGTIKLSVGTLETAEIVQQPQPVTLVDTFIDDGYYWHILDVEKYEETGQKDALLVKVGDSLIEKKDVTLTASAKGEQLSCCWLVNRGGSWVVLNSDQYETTEEDGVLTSTLTIPVRTYTKPARYYCSFSNAAGVVYSEDAFVALKPSMKRYQGNYTGYPGQSVTLQFMTTRPDCACVWEKYTGTKVSGKWHWGYKPITELSNYSADKYKIDGYKLTIYDLDEDDVLSNVTGNSNLGKYRCRPVYELETALPADETDTTLHLEDPPEQNIITSLTISGFITPQIGQRVAKTSDLNVQNEHVELLSIQWTSGVTTADNGNIIVTSETPSYTIYLQAKTGYCFQYNEQGKFPYSLNNSTSRAGDGPRNTMTNIIALSYSYGASPVIAPPDTIVFEQTEFTVYKGYDNRVQIPVTVTPNELLSGQTRTLQSLTLVTEGPEEYAYAPLPDGLYLAGSTPGLLWGVVHDDVEPGTYFVCVRAVSSHGDEQLAAIAIVVEELPEHLTPHEHSFSKWAADDGGTHARKCSTCHLVERHAHVWNDGTVVTPASESAHGVMRYTCAVCGATREAPYLYEYEPDWTASVSAKLEGSKMTCRVIASKAVDAVAIVATYDADGRVLECRAENVTPRLNVPAEFSVTFKGAARRYCVYLVDAATFAPLCTRWSYTAE